MQFEFKGQTFEVSEDSVIFVVDKNSCITGLEFRKPVELKPRWQVILSTRNVGNTDTGILFESDDYNACRDRFTFEKERLIKDLMIRTDNAYRLTATLSGASGYMVFSVTDERNAEEYYLRLMKK